MALPATPTLDDFSRPDESPLSWGGKWAAIDTDFPGALNLTNRVVVNPSATDSGAMYWTQLSAIGASEVYVELRGTISTVGPMLFLRLQGVGGAAAWDGYRATISSGTCQLQRFDNGGSSNLGTASVGVMAAGDVLVFRAVANLLTMYRVRAGTVYQLFSAADSTYPTGQIGFGVFATATTAFANFGGGPLGVPLIAGSPIEGLGAA